ncbi:homoserine O-succinyltransferase, partial [Lactobacillus delbrueckii subsp. bulgaricus]|nr:homoserine O-succinyltransferase [Lactobacillus delbrueckii subsp. bulgaricus]
MFSQIYLLFFKKGLTNKMSKKIGILNLMHDKIDT